MEKHIQERIVEHLAAGGVVRMATRLRITYFDKRHVSMFRKPSRAEESGVYVQQGKSWVYAFPYLFAFSKQPAETDSE